MPTLQFKGKNSIWNHHLAVPYHALEEIPKLAFQADKGAENLIVEGDNLLALKALLPRYQGKVKCVYIDPPYNTGNEGWVYNDKVNSPLIKEWLGKEVGKDDLTRHDKWLCMMVPRMKLIRDLLDEDGVIFISIDDNAQHILRLAMHEIFGEENFIAVLPTIMNLKGNQDEFGFAGTHEYTIVYAKNKGKCVLNHLPIPDEEEDDWEEDEYGYYKRGANLKATGTNAPRKKRPNLYFPVFYSLSRKAVYVTANDKATNSDDIKVFPMTEGKEMSWRWSKERFQKERHNIIVVMGEKEPSFYKKQRPGLSDLPSKKPKTLFYKPEYSSGNGTNQLRQFFDGRAFPNPKPLDLITDFIRIGMGKHGLLLDPFAGSGTTMHAAMDLNNADGGKRSCILIQMPESSENEPKKNICKDITRERIKKAIEKNDYKSGFNYLRVGDPIDAETLLSGKLPTWKTFAEYVYYLGTGTHLADKAKANEKSGYIGSHGREAVYLLYKDDYSALTRMALNLETAERILKEQKGKKCVVYAPACFLDEDYLREKNIEFVGIPYNLFRRNG